MANSDELRDRLSNEEESGEQKRQRIQDAIDAREHAEEYKNDSETANQEADDAEAAIDSNQSA